MKRILKYMFFIVMTAVMAAGCAEWVTPERVITQHPDEQSPILKDDAYWQALREYKQKGDHKIAFGWYGSWTATGASYQSRLVSAPDSMDIISIWSQWHSLTPEQIADKEYVQKVKGTKVTFTTFLDNIPAEFRAGETPTEEEIAVFAKAWACDSINKYNYDGMDIDYEPGYGASGPLVGNPCPELFNVLIRELGKYLGPKSGTGKLLMIDGVPYAVRGEMAEYFDYGIVQAYASSGYTDLQNRFNNAYNNGWKPEQYIFAENFESYWQNGGVTHTTREGESVNSLLGMARFNPTQGFCAGFGAYHMEYEYANSSKPYKYMREAIQDVNPAGGSLVVSLTSTSLDSYSFIIEDDGSLSGSMDAEITLNFARPVPSDLELAVTLDNSLVDAYNEANGTEYMAVDPGNVTLNPVVATQGSILSEPSAVGFNAEGLDEGQYLLPVVVSLPENDIYVSSEPLVKYILVTVGRFNIVADATSLSGVKIEPAAGWTITCYQGTNDSGANGVWNLDSDEQKARMFDGLLDENCWYASSASYSWGYGGNFIVELDAVYDISGFRWHIYYQDCDPQITDVRYSTDGNNWTSLTSGRSFVPSYDDNYWKIFQFSKTVSAKYIRVYVGNLTGYTSMNEIEFNTPSN
ncbi:MAG: DUF1735 domain-containing protein [Bacteroidetes bacterium]|uniref:DUF1735 domain-containing protein n=1 Tax=Candidatus Cryptobacteroides merdavium TaxID=2840769 RepID=A0A9D9EB10_9BACT|nr:DUF1735 domain-containing protein [Candidatus Cryptobacteroides merdavium]